jgi:hypothetical protein
MNLFMAAMFPNVLHAAGLMARRGLLGFRHNLADLAEVRIVFALGWGYVGSLIFDLAISRLKAPLSDRYCGVLRKN